MGIWALHKPSSSRERLLTLYDLKLVLVCKSVEMFCCWCVRRKAPQVTTEILFPAGMQLKVLLENETSSLYSISKEMVLIFIGTYWFLNTCGLMLRFCISNITAFLKSPIDLFVLSEKLLL